MNKTFLKLYLLTFLVLGMGALFAFSFLMQALDSDAGAGAGVIMTGFFLPFAVLLYFIPSAVAYGRRHPNLVGILILNTAGGWFLLGWIGALIWAFYRPHIAGSVPPPLPVNTVRTPTVEDELAQLSTLKSRGLISDQEFSEKRQLILAKLA